MFSIPVKSHCEPPADLEYPLGPEEISAALADVPQSGSLALRFHARQTTFESRTKPYCVLQVIYAGLPGNRFAWAITVHAVPTEHREPARRVLLSTALPSVRQWLVVKRGVHGTPVGESVMVLFDPVATTFRLVEHHDDSPYAS